MIQIMVGMAFITAAGGAPFIEIFNGSG